MIRPRDFVDGIAVRITRAFGGVGFGQGACANTIAIVWTLEANTLIAYTQSPTRRAFRIICNIQGRF